MPTHGGRPRPSGWARWRRCSIARAPVTRHGSSASFPIACRRRRRARARDSRAARGHGCLHVEAAPSGSGCPALRPSGSCSNWSPGSLTALAPEPGGAGGPRENPMRPRHYLFAAGAHASRAVPGAEPERRAPLRQERGWKDTVAIEDDEEVDVTPRSVHGMQPPRAAQHRARGPQHDGPRRRRVKNAGTRNWGWRLGEVGGCFAGPPSLAASRSRYKNFASDALA